jgi:hypothetical protein
VDYRDIDDMLRRHRRQRLRPWLCRCGLRHACPPRRLAKEEQIKLDTRARMEVVMKQLREQADQGRPHSSTYGGN